MKKFFPIGMLFVLFQLIAGCANDPSQEKEEVSMEYIFPEYTSFERVVEALGSDYTKDYFGIGFDNEDGKPTDVEKKVYANYIVTYERLGLVYKFNFHDELLGVVK